MITFAIPDLHGRYDLLCKALETIESKYPVGRVIFLGDYIDRGPQSKEILDRLMAGPPSGWEWVILKGNHETIMHSCLGGHAAMSWWLNNGGVNTLRSFGIELGGLVDNTTTAHIQPYIDWVMALPNIYVDEHRVYVHGGLDEDIAIENHPENILLWHRYTYGEGWNGHSGKHVVHGHTPSRHGAQRYGGRTNLDGMAYGTNKLWVGVFKDDVPGGPIDILMITTVFAPAPLVTPPSPIFVIGELGSNDKS